MIKIMDLFGRNPKNWSLNQRKTAAVERIGVTHDIFRSPALGQWDGTPQARWLREFITPALVHLGVAVDLPIALSGGQVMEFLASLGAEAENLAGTEGWAALYGDPALGDKIGAMLAPLLKCDIIVGYEMSANQIRYLSKSGKRFVDIGVDPLRFSSRSLFRLRTNCPGIDARWQRFHIAPDQLADELGFLRAQMARLRGFRDAPATDLMFVGQVEVDASRIVGGQMATLQDGLQVLAALARSHARMSIYPHPLARSNHETAFLLQRFRHAAIGHGSVYAALCDPATRTVATLASSVAAEAELLGKVAVRLITPDASTEALGPAVVSRFIRVGEALASVALWEAIVDPPKERRDRTREALAPTASSLAGAIRAELGIFAADAAALGADRRIALDAPATFATPDVHARYCAFGWSGAEPRGTWSDGRVALLSLRPEGPFAGVLLAFRPFIGPSGRTLRMEIRLCEPDRCDPPLWSGAFDAEDHQVIYVPVSGDATTRSLDLKLLFEEPCSPASLGISGDDRTLGIFLQSLCVVSLPPSSTAAAIHEADSDRSH